MTTNTRHERARAPRDKTLPWKRLLSGALVLLLLTGFLAACGTTDQQEAGGTELPGADIATEIAEPEAMATEPVPVTGDEQATETVTGTSEAGETATEAMTGTTEAGETVTGTTGAATMEPSETVTGPATMEPSETMTGAATMEPSETVTGPATMEPSETVTGATGPATEEPGETGTATTGTGATTPGGVLTLGDLTDNPDAYAGQTVAVEGQVALVLNPNVFTIADPQLVDLGQVLVINTNQTAATPTIEEGQSVRVSGTVDRFDQAEIESQLGGIDLPDALLAGFEGQVVIMADSVEVTGSSQ